MILTSGTTGTPKGASRGNPQSLDPAVSLLSKIPLRARQVNHVAAPLFHSWGFAHFSLGLILGTTYVLRRKFEPEACLAEVARYRCDVARRGAGDDAADPRAARGDARASTTCPR